MTKVMVNIETDGPCPTLDELQRRYQLSDGEIDKDFGVVEVDNHVYTILVDQRAAQRITPTEDWKCAGPFANPRIAPFGPPEAQA